MLIQMILFLLAGVLAGTVTGLIPGIHINLIGVMLVSMSAEMLSFLDPLYIVVFIASMAITHTFIDFIPSVFLGCPDTDTELSVLPGHELLKKGHGYQAVVLSAYGSLAAVLILLLIALPSALVISKAYGFIREAIPYLLITASMALIFLEQRRTKALFVFLLSGFLGWSVLNIPPSQLKQPLLPLLTGLFGSSMLILSIKNKIRVPKQKIVKPKAKLLRPLAGAAIASPACSFLPGLGSGQAAIIGNSLTKCMEFGRKNDQKSFLVLLGATNTIVMGFSFISLFAISRTRTGAAAAIKEIAGIPSAKILILILSIVLISGIISYFLTTSLAEFFSTRLEKASYTGLSLSALAVLILVVFLVSGIFGVLVLAISTLTGIYSISLRVRRTNMMGCLMIPTIMLYLI